MCVCVHVCTYVCACAFVCESIVGVTPSILSINVSTAWHMHVDVSEYVCVHVCACVCAFGVCLCVRVHVCVYLFV